MTCRNTFLTRFMQSSFMYLVSEYLHLFFFYMSTFLFNFVVFFLEIETNFSLEKLFSSLVWSRLTPGLSSSVWGSESAIVSCDYGSIPLTDYVFLPLIFDGNWVTFVRKYVTFLSIVSMVDRIGHCRFLYV